MKDNKTSQAVEAASGQARRGNNPVQRILLVDDDAEIRRHSVRVLIDSGYEVDAAEDGAAAWDTLQLNSYDLLITDNNMPKVSGVELLKKLRTARMIVPVIMATGAVPEAVFIRFPNLQPDAMLLKPYGAEEILKTVKKVLRATDSPREEIAPLPDRHRQPSADDLQLS